MTTGALRARPARSLEQESGCAARSARKMYSFEPKLARITTRTSFSSLDRRRPPGGLDAVEDRHLDVHQGDVRAASTASVTACRPSAASATTSTSSSASSSARMPLRISAGRRRAGSINSPGSQPGFGENLEAAAVSGSGVAARLPSAVTCSRMPMRPRPCVLALLVLAVVALGVAGCLLVLCLSRCSCCCCGVGHADAGAVVVDLDLEGVRRVAEVDPRRGLAAWRLTSARRFLDDPVGGLVTSAGATAWRRLRSRSPGDRPRARARQAVQVAEADCAAVRRCAARRASCAVPACVRARLLDRQQRGDISRRACAPGAPPRRTGRRPRTMLWVSESCIAAIRSRSSTAICGDFVLVRSASSAGRSTSREVQPPDARRHDHHAGRDDPSGRVNLCRPRSVPFSEPTRNASSTVSAWADHFLRLPGSSRAGQRTRAEQVEVGSAGRTTASPPVGSIDGMTTTLSTAWRRPAPRAAAAISAWRCSSSRPRNS